MLDEELLKKYKAKSDKSIFEHNQDLKKQKDVLINLGYLNDKEKIELLSYAIDYHGTRSRRKGSRLPADPAQRITGSIVQIRQRFFGRHPHFPRKAGRYGRSRIEHHPA